MAYDFPSSPTVGQIANGYVWNGQAWAGNGNLAAVAPPSDAPPSSPVSGQLWYETDTGKLFIWYNDGNSSQWVQISGPGLGDAPVDGRAYSRSNGIWVPDAQRRNRIVNPAFQISQENARVSNITNAYYFADQWYSNASATFLSGKTAWGSTAPGATGNGNMFMACSGAATPGATGDYASALQMIEGNNIVDFQWGAASAKPAVLRFRSVVSSGAPKVLAVALRTYNASHSFVKNCVLSGTPQEFVIPIPGPTVGAWATDNAAALQLWFTMSCSADLIAPSEGSWLAGNYIAGPGMTNGHAASGPSFLVWDVGLYADPTASGIAPPFETPNYSEELLRCKRYWQKLSNLVVETNALSQSTVFPVELSRIPTVAGGGAGFTSANLTPTSGQFYQTTRAYQTLTINGRI